MQFIREDQTAATHAVAARLSQELGAGKRVLWLVCGGSNIKSEVAVMDQLRTRQAESLGRLTILPTDERYGEPGHADSNYRQLQDAGFDPGDASWTDILGENLSLEATVEQYATAVSRALATADVVIAQFGIGGDGHIAGILPGSPATATENTLAAGYQSNDFIRMTLTSSALSQVNAAYAPVYGDSKRAALERLKRHDESFADLPSSLLYDIPEAYVYTDNDI